MELDSEGSTVSRILQCSHASVGLTQARPNEEVTGSCFMHDEGLIGVSLQCSCLAVVRGPPCQLSLNIRALARVQI